MLLTNLASLLIGFAMFANMLLTTQQLQLPAIIGYGFELNVITAGLCMVPSLLAMVPPAMSAVLPPKGVLLRLHRLGHHRFNRGGRRHGHCLRRHAHSDHGAVPVTDTASANGLNSLVRAIGTSTSSAAIAAVFTAVTLTVANTRLPSFDAFKDIFWMAALASAASMLAAVFIPRAAGVRRPPVTDVGAADLVVQGRVLAPDHRPLTPAVVTVLQTDGEPVDWSRVDTEGNYCVALPGTGKYLMVANAAGWAPMAKVFEFDGRTLKQNFLLREQLQLRGTVTAGSAPLAVPILTLLGASGGHVGATTTDADGRHALPLPVVGHYVVAMLDPATQDAAAQKVIVDIQSVTLDLAYRRAKCMPWEREQPQPRRHPPRSRPPVRDARLPCRHSAGRRR
ncbi:MFS transporter (plasmid) [Arthrobacter sp. Z1-9]